MKVFQKLTASILLPGLAFALPIDIHSHADSIRPSLMARRSAETSKERRWCDDKAEVIYFMTNLASNSIVAISVSDDGFLTSVASETATGGAGGNQIFGMAGGPLAGPDALSSQGSVQIAGDLLFALNAGSNTLSCLSIDKDDPTKLTLLGSPMWTGGDFPVTVAASKDLGVVCVGNTGAAAGVSCAKFDEWSGLSAFDALRPFPLGQTTPPIGPLNGIAQVLFSDDMSTLIAMVKGDTTSVHPGFVATFPVEWSSKTVSYSVMETTPAGSKVLFGTTTIPGTDHLLASDAAFGALILDLADLSTPLALTNITNQKATCWAVYSEMTGTGFVDDVVVSQLVEIDVGSGAIVSVANPENGGQGMIDMRSTGSKIYALTPGNGTLPAAVTVFDVSGGRGTAKAVQNFPVSGADKNAEGLAVYMSKKW